MAFEFKHEFGVVIGVTSFPKSGFSNYTVRVVNRSSDKVTSAGTNCVTFIGKCQYGLGDYLEFAVDKSGLLIMATILDPSSLPADSLLTYTINHIDNFL